MASSGSASEAVRTEDQAEHDGSPSHQLPVDPTHQLPVDPAHLPTVEPAGSMPQGSPHLDFPLDHVGVAPDEWAEVHSSPRLSRKTLDELGQENEAVGDPENLPLHTPWTFWFDRAQKGSSAQDYFANLRNLCVVKTIKAFWCVFNNLIPVDQLQERESYHLMRNEGRRPVWEDEANVHGGLWSFKVRKEDTAAVWQEVLLATVGEQFSEFLAEGDDICGVSVRIRGYERNVIQIWNEDSELHYSSSVIQKVKQLVPHLEINEFYQSNRAKHKDSLMKPHAPFHRGLSPPPLPLQRRYTGAPPTLQPMFMPPGPPMYPPGPHPRHAPPAPPSPAIDNHTHTHLAIPVPSPLHSYFFVL